MSKRTYDKLIRDKIPQIIRDNGEEPEVYILSDYKFMTKLEEKLQEEMDEYLASKDIEELADLVEVIHALVKAKGYRWEHFERIRLDKVAERGAFDKQLCLKSVKTTDHVTLRLFDGQDLEFDTVGHKIEDGVFTVELEGGAVQCFDMSKVKDYSIRYASKRK